MEITQSLFGATPESIQQARDAALNTQAAQYAEMDPFQRSAFSIYKGANQLGGAIGGMLGGQDPQMQQAAKMQQLTSQFDTTTPDGLMGFARAAVQAGMPQQAQMAAQKAQAMKNEGLDTTIKQQSIDATTASQTQLDGFRKAIAALGTKPTQEQLLSVASRFGDAKTLVTALQHSADKELLADAKVEAAKVKLEGDLLLLKQQGVDKKDIERMHLEGLRSIAQLSASLKGPPKLAVGLQKSEDEDLAKINAGIAQQETFTKPLESLKVDPKTGVPLLNLGPLNNQRYKLDNALGRSTPASRAYEQFQAAITEATNIKTDAAKGVQTDSDVLRQANGLITAFGKNDNAASVEALTRFNGAVDRAATRTKKIIEDRRKSQNVESYYGVPTAPQREGALGTAGNPIRL